ncbi:hypothetical protein F4703DRAFT_1970767 [Phycomyces blakesleeanus]
MFNVQCVTKSCESIIACSKFQVNEGQSFYIKSPKYKKLILKNWGRHPSIAIQYDISSRFQAFCLSNLVVLGYTILSGFWVLWLWYPNIPSSWFLPSMSEGEDQIVAFVIFPVFVGVSFEV